ncbi:MAG: helix-turn-helix transcriptional regulator [Pseudomonadota bacterium]
MATKQSLFAQKLKSWWTSHGENGRVTQEGLAEILGISVEAVSKYERSVSFIRGDLEHRLADRLGWPRSEIVACREDWELRAQSPDRAPYRVVDKEVVDDVFGGSWGKVVDAMNTMAGEQFAEIPGACPVDRDLFDRIYENFSNQWRAIECDGQIVAKWVLLTLFDEDEALFDAGQFDEDTLTLDRICQPILPGTYFGYSPALVVRPGHEGASTLLISSFTEHLEELADRGVLYHAIGAVAVSRGGERICQGLGMDDLGEYHACGTCVGCTMWRFSGAGIARSIFARRSALIRASYSAEFVDDLAPSLCIAH